MNEEDSHFVFVSIFIVIAIIFLILVFSIQEFAGDLGLILGDEWFVLKFILLVILIVSLAYLIKKIAHKKAQTSIEILRGRYEQGEISKQEYENLARKLKESKGPKPHNLLYNPLPSSKILYPPLRHWPSLIKTAVSQRFNESILRIISILVLID